jgi:hypothetical protein
MQELRKARTILNGYNFMGYQALGLGPADLQLGVDTLRELEKEARFPFLCANLVDKTTKKPIFRPSVVLEVGGIKIGLYAVMMSELNETYSRRVIPNSEFLDPEKVTKELVPELRKTCDMVVALSHLNVDANERILSANPGIDVLVDPLSKAGTKAIWVQENEYCVPTHGTPLVRIDGQGSRLGLFEMYFTPGAKRFAAYIGHDVALEPHIMRHPEMTRLVEAYEHGRTLPYTIDFDPAKVRLSEEFLGEEACGTCHQEQYEYWKGTKHAHAFASLEKEGNQTHGDCIGCHSLGYGVTFADTKSVGKFKEVQCESCHVSKPGHAENPKTVRLGAAPEENCWGCHNKDYTQKPFDYAASLEKTACPKIKG